MSYWTFKKKNVVHNLQFHNIKYFHHLLCIKLLDFKIGVELTSFNFISNFSYKLLYGIVFL
jgi:hypothetical protein